MEKLKVVLAGFGGQGLLFGGKVIAYCGLIDDREVSWLPSYGPEMRGGTANCSVTISDDPIGSPLVTAPTVLIAMNQPSFDKYIGTVVPDGIALVDTTMVPNITYPEGVRVIEVPASAIAEEQGLKGLANIILIGKMHALTEFCDLNTLEEAIRQCVPPRKAALVEKNLEALKIGREL